MSRLLAHWTLGLLLLGAAVGYGAADGAPPFWRGLAVVLLHLGAAADLGLAILLDRYRAGPLVRAALLLFLAWRLMA